VSFSLSPGEIVGVVGRAGCGRSALGRTIFGLESRTSGSISVGGRNLPRNKPWSALRAGVGYVGQDRRRAGAIYGTSVSTNLTIASLDRLSHRGWLSASEEKASAMSLIEQCDVRPADHTERMENLSGGNQQKIVLGRWIPRKPNVLVLDEPTEGVDVGARQGIYSIIHRLTEQGCGVLVLSSSIEELVQLSDRVLFMAHGEIETELSGDALSVETIENLLLFAGARAEDGATPDVSIGRTVQ
jgi:ribose transport system ATP-binding protein